MTGKIEEKVVHLSEISSGSQRSQAKKGADVQWEGSKTQKGETKFEYKQVPNSLPSMIEVKEESPKPELGPMAMPYNLTIGWIAEIMGPTTKHWKRLARGSKTSELIKNESPIKQKREGSMPLIDLDPYALEQKR